MDSDRHINFKLLRDRILSGAARSVPPAVAGGSSTDHPPATAGGTDSMTARQYWRSLEELADSPIFEEFVQREFPHAAEEWNDPVERRPFLKLMGASLALAGLSGCVIQPPEKVIPYVKQPEEEVPGKGLFFATAYSLSGIATPLLVRSNEGRPTKVEGNPDHPSNPGATATDIFSQASVLTLYDFSKADRILSLGSDFLSAMPGTLRYARDYAAKRRVVTQTDFNLGVTSSMTRLYVIESSPTITGANADHRFPVKPGQMEGV